MPSLEQLLVETTELRLTKGVEIAAAYKQKMAMLRRVQQLHEQNPMLGLRVCRLGIVFPEIYAMQVRAIFEAACELKQRGVDARPDVMIPGVGTKEEMQVTHDAAKAVADEVIAQRRHAGRRITSARWSSCRARASSPTSWPRSREFFSFGTNDLTQTTYGYSRDDAEASLHSGLSREEDSQGRSVPSARPSGRRRA